MNFLMVIMASGTSRERVRTTTTTTATEMAAILQIIGWQRHGVLVYRILLWYWTSMKEGGVNTSYLADPMIIAIMTSRRKKRANAQNFRKWRRRLSLKQRFEADFSDHSSFKWYCIRISWRNNHCSFLRGEKILIITEKSCIKCIWSISVIALEWKYVVQNFDYSSCKIAFFTRSVIQRNV